MSTVADRLHSRLKALGFDVFKPKRIWLGRGHDNGDWWRWSAGERISEGHSKIGCSLSMSNTLKLNDADLRSTVRHD